MLIIEVDKGNIEKALKRYKSKVNKTKQLKKLRKLKQFEKNSTKKRAAFANAKYLQSLKTMQDQ
jgi:small subunit ribosomal protein S21